MPDDATEYRLQAVERAVQSIEKSLRTLVELEVRHKETRDALGRAFKQLDRQERRAAFVTRVAWIAIGMWLVLGIGAGFAGNFTLGALDRLRALGEHVERNSALIDANTAELTRQQGVDNVQNEVIGHMRRGQ